MCSSVRLARGSRPAIPHVGWMIVETVSEWLGIGRVWASEYYSRHNRELKSSSVEKMLNERTINTIR